jgi:hypothetical protein
VKARPQPRSEEEAWKTDSRAVDSGLEHISVVGSSGVANEDNGDAESKRLRSWNSLSGSHPEYSRAIEEFASAGISPSNAINTSDYLGKQNAYVSHFLGRPLPLAPHDHQAASFGSPTASFSGDSAASSRHTYTSSSSSSSSVVSANSQPVPMPIPSSGSPNTATIPPSAAAGASEPACSTPHSSTNRQPILRAKACAELLQSERVFVGHLYRLACFFLLPLTGRQLTKQAATVLQGAISLDKLRAQQPNQTPATGTGIQSMATNAAEKGKEGDGGKIARSLFGWMQSSSRGPSSGGSKGPVISGPVSTGQPSALDRGGNPNIQLISAGPSLQVPHKSLGVMVSAAVPTQSLSPPELQALGETLGRKDVELLFGGLEDLLPLHCEVLETLNRVVEGRVVGDPPATLDPTDRIPTSWRDDTLVGDAMAKLAPFLRIHARYTANYGMACRLLERLMNPHYRVPTAAQETGANGPTGGGGNASSSSSASGPTASFPSAAPSALALIGAHVPSAAAASFRDFVRRQESDPACAGQTLRSLLIMPIQRVPRYALLLKEALRFTPEGHPDRLGLQRALEVIERTARELNESISRYERQQRVARLQSLFDPAPVPSLVQPARDFVRDGVLSIAVKTRPLRLRVFVFILFSDGTLVYAAPDVAISLERDRERQVARGLTLGTGGRPASGEFPALLGHSAASTSAQLPSEMDWGYSTLRLHGQLTAVDADDVDSLHMSAAAVEAASKAGADPRLCFRILGQPHSLVAVASTSEGKAGWLQDLRTVLDGLNKRRQSFGVRAVGSKDAAPLAPIPVLGEESKKCRICQSSFGLLRRRRICNRCGLQICHNCCHLAAKVADGSLERGRDEDADETAADDDIMLATIATESGARSERRPRPNKARTGSNGSVFRSFEEDDTDDDESGSHIGAPGGGPADADTVLRKELSELFGVSPGEAKSTSDHAKPHRKASDGAVSVTTSASSRTGADFAESVSGSKGNKASRSGRSSGKSGTDASKSILGFGSGQSAEESERGQQLQADLRQNAAKGRLAGYICVRCAGGGKPGLDEEPVAPSILGVNTARSASATTAITASASIAQLPAKTPVLQASTLYAAGPVRTDAPSLRTSLGPAVITSPPRHATPVVPRQSPGVALSTNPFAAMMAEMETAPENTSKASSPAAAAPEMEPGLFLPPDKNGAPLSGAGQNAHQTTSAVGTSVDDLLGIRPSAGSSHAAPKPAIKAPEPEPNRTAEEMVADALAAAMLRAADQRAHAPERSHMGSLPKSSATVQPLPRPHPVQERTEMQSAMSSAAASRVTHIRGGPPGPSALDRLKAIDALRSNQSPSSTAGSAATARSHHPPSTPVKDARVHWEAHAHARPHETHGHHVGTAHLHSTADRLSQAAPSATAPASHDAHAPVSQYDVRMYATPFPVMPASWVPPQPSLPQHMGLGMGAVPYPLQTMGLSGAPQTVRPGMLPPGAAPRPPAAVAGPWSNGLASMQPPPTAGPWAGYPGYSPALPPLVQHQHAMDSRTHQLHRPPQQSMPTAPSPFPRTQFNPAGVRPSHSHEGHSPVPSARHTINAMERSRGRSRDDDADSDAFDDLLDLSGLLGTGKTVISTTTTTTKKTYPIGMDPPDSATSFAMHPHHRSYPERHQRPHNS